VSMRKPRPGRRWITGVQRAQLQKVFKYTNSLVAANGKLPLAQQPMTAQDIIAFQGVNTRAGALLLLLA
jgi:hypothetical protein